MDTSTFPTYRGIRPDNPLLEFVRQQSQPVFVHRQDKARLSGLANVAILPYGGPQPGEVWLPLEVQS